jgi:hypothetical protein
LLLKLIIVKAEAKPMSGIKSVNGLTVEQVTHLAQARDRARQLYEQAYQKSWWEMVHSIFEGGIHRLLDLERFYATCTVVSCQDLAVRPVPIHQIRGSVSSTRSCDFDANFRPLKTHDKERWLNVATACERGVQLPPVTLVQIGNIYFVEDGHHRISVAQAMGQTEIVALITLLQVSGTLPWEEQRAAGVKPTLNLLKQRLFSEVK